MEDPQQVDITVNRSDEAENAATQRQEHDKIEKGFKKALTETI